MLCAETGIDGGADDIKVVERFFELPLDYSDANGVKIQVFARKLIPKNKAKTEEDEEELPYCTPDWLDAFEILMTRLYPCFTQCFFYKAFRFISASIRSLTDLGNRWPRIRGRIAGKLRILRRGKPCRR